MIKAKGLAAVVATAIGLGGVAAPALAGSLPHWTSKECMAYVRAFHKHHKHPTKSQLANANLVLKSYRCTQHVK